MDERPYPDFRRASGDRVCTACKRPYRRHPDDREFLDWDGNPYLVRLCDGSLVKL